MSLPSIFFSFGLGNHHMIKTPKSIYMKNSLFIQNEIIFLNKTVIIRHDFDLVWASKINCSKLSQTIVGIFKK